METINLGVGDGLPPVDWDGVVQKLADGSPPAPDAHNARTTWLTTLNEDGSPHVTAVGALWLDGTFWFTVHEGRRYVLSASHFDEPTRTNRSAQLGPFTASGELDASLPAARKFASRIVVCTHTSVVTPATIRCVTSCRSRPCRASR